MADDRDSVEQLFATIACEQVVIDEIAAASERLVEIQRAKRELASLDADSRRLALSRRHAALGASA